jgi:hypothetical protein
MVTKTALKTNAVWPKPLGHEEAASFHKNEAEAKPPVAITARKCSGANFELTGLLMRFSLILRLVYLNNYILSSFDAAIGKAYREPLK